MKVCDAIVQWCSDIDTPFVAGIPASGIIDIIEGLSNSNGGAIPFILTRHEQSAAMMACSYAFHTHRPAVVMASKSPGATNLAIGVMGAYTESIPMIVITMQVSNEHERLEAFEEIDLAEFFKSITKWSVQANNPRRVLGLLNEAYRRAMSGRPGPVHVTVPYNFMQSDAGPYVTPVIPESNTAIRAGLLREILAVLRAADRPLIIAGGGIPAGSEQDVLAVSEALGTPIVASWLRKPVSDSHGNLVGIAGIGGSPAARTAIANADVVLALGCRFSEQMTEHYRMHFAQGVRLIHIDLDAAVIGRVFPAEFGIVGDVADILPQLRSAIEESPAAIPESPGKWLSALQAEQAQYRKMLDSQETPAPDIGGREVVRELRQALPPGSKLILDSGNYLHWAEQYFAVDGAGQFHYPTSGTMGFGIPGAIGAKFAKPDAFVCALVGDGGFAMTMGELETARRINIPILVVIVNNHTLGHIRMRQDQKFGKHAGSDFINQRFEHVPRAFDIDAHHVETIEEFRTVLPRAVAKVQAGDSVVIDVHVTDELAAGPLTIWWNE